MTKLLKDHPMYASTMAFIQEQIQKCRPSAIQIAVANVTLQGLNTDPPDRVRQITEAVEQMETRMEKKLKRYYGMNGKYVAH